MASQPVTPSAEGTGDDGVHQPGAPEEQEVEAAQPRDLRKEAKSLDHCLFLREFNPYCDGCVRGKSRDVPHYTGPQRREVTHFGSVITADIVHMVDANLGTGVGGVQVCHGNSIPLW